MDARETELLESFLNQLVQARAVGKDTRAEAMIRAAVAPGFFDGANGWGNHVGAPAAAPVPSAPPQASRSGFLSDSFMDDSTLLDDMSDDPTII